MNACCEKLRPMKKAAAMLGLPYFKVQRAVKLGLVPSYRLYNKRKLVRVSEILAAMKQQSGGADV